MSAKTEKKLENLENDVIGMEEKLKEFAEKLKKKKEKTEETRNLAIVEIVRERNMTISDLKAVLDNGGKPLDNDEKGQSAPAEVTETAQKFNYRKETDDNEEID